VSLPPPSGPTSGPGTGDPGFTGDPGLTGVPRSIDPDDPRNRVADALRRIGATAVGHPMPYEDLARAADELSVIAAALEKSAPQSKRPRRQPDTAGHPQDFFPGSPMIGFANPVAPPAEIWTVEGDDGRREIRGRVTFGYAYEGPPTCVHGGIIAALFDELMGAANLITENAGMTGTLTVRYRKPTPLLAPLDLVARFMRREGRKIFTWAGIYYAGELTAEADGLFIAVPPERMLAIATANAGETDAPVLDEQMAQFITDSAGD
jgi:acyl-coenzyme A thioesterase PaaI-like protein